MKFLIELDGPVLDLKKSYLHAYHVAVDRLGRQCESDVKFWRLIRSGADEGQLVRGAKPDQLRAFVEHFKEALEGDEAIALCEQQPDVGVALSALREFGELILVTIGSNRFARQMLLDKFDLAIQFSRMKVLTSEVNQRVNQLKELAEGDPRVVVACASEALVRASGRASLLPVGVECGHCDGTRLMRAGAQMLFGGLNELEEEVASGGEKLVQAGLLPQQFSKLGGGASREVEGLRASSKESHHRFERRR